jgi:hypothetical protein
VEDVKAILKFTGVDLEEVKRKAEKRNTSNNQRNNS